MPTLTYGKTDIHYILYREQRSDLKISVTLINGVEVFAPENLDVDKLHDHLKKKAPWILNKINAFKQVKTSIQRKEFVSGEKLPYLGRQYRLKVCREPVSTAAIRFYRGRFIATVPKNWPQEKVDKALEQQLVEWYRHRGTIKLKEKANHFQSLLDVRPKSINIRSQYKRWGSCTPDGDIYINWRLIMAPSNVFEYVIVHELAHLLVRDHSTAFWKIVKSILPDYKKRKEWLRIHGMTLHNIGSDAGGRQI
ncbi:SprT family zinc-dependent metalloprotease [Lentibacillus sp.]|uniref:M48 family metallopeptidase n=1 Tax=Lentibacillus sp. TaxID=1925746 RepID=UPI002B4B8416|nr:SprT family zinc-dependent metalloprotease [Lentibacillus sp.]HLS09880.1 SprT family zinc-dependent metalloprotease [Lentibacillus sp.]